MARRQKNGDGGIAQGHLLAVGRDDVALGHPARHVVRLGDGIPVGRAHDDARAIFVLQHLGAFVMIAMAVADDHIFDGGGIEAQAS